MSRPLKVDSNRDTVTLFTTVTKLTTPIVLPHQPQTSSYHRAIRPAVRGKSIPILNHCCLFFYHTRKKWAKAPPSPWSYLPHLSLVLHSRLRSFAISKKKEKVPKAHRLGRLRQIAVESGRVRNFRSFRVSGKIFFGKKLWWKIKFRVFFSEWWIFFLNVEQCFLCFFVFWKRVCF